MDIALGIALIIITFVIAWVGQVISAVSPPLAERIGLQEPEADVDPVVRTDAFAEAIWDVISTWTLPVAGILLLLNSGAWAYFGLVGGGMYLYFAGRFITVRTVMRRRMIRVGKPELLGTYFAMASLWAVTAVVTIVAAVFELE